MQFFDRPGRSRIALRGSSSRAATSDQLLAQARKAREQRAHQRAQRQAATTLQSVLRCRIASCQSAQLLGARDACNPDAALIQLLFVGGVFGDRATKLSVRVGLVRRAVVVREGIALFVNRLAAELGRKDLHIGEGGVTERIVVKGIAVVLAAAARRVTETGEDVQFLNGVASTVIRMLRFLTMRTVGELASWGVCVHLTDLLASVALRGSGGEEIGALSDLMKEMLRLVEGGDAKETAILYRQIAMSLLSADGVLRCYQWMRNPVFVKKLFKALATERLGKRDGEDEGRSNAEIEWDLANDVAELDMKRIAIALSNALELGDTLWAEQDKDTLWSFVASVSTLLELLSQQWPLEGETEDDMSDDEGAGEREGTEKELSDASTLRSVIKRLGSTLKRVVSDDNVRILMTGAVAEGRHAVIRVCQLFSFLTRREKSLNMSLRNALAFWRVKGSSQPHILSSLWKFCLKTSEEDGNSDAMVDVMSCPLREDSAPILVVFACSYSYLLYIQDGDEMFENQWPFSVDEVREVALVLKKYLYYALYARPTTYLSSASSFQNNSLLHKEPGLLDEVSRLLSRLYNCDARRQFSTSDDFWLAGKGALSSEAFLHDAITAGPEALVQPAESNDFRGVRKVRVRLSSVNGAGELLRMAPFLVPFSTRAKIFQSWVARERDKANAGRPFISMSDRSVSVRRKFIFEDAFEELNGLGSDLKGTIRVKFIDEHGIEEAGIDGGGVFKEFMYEVLRLGFSPFSYGLFKATPDGRLYPSPDAALANENFKTQFAFLGRLLGKAVFDGVLVDIPLARFFISKILGQFNYPNDLDSLDPELHKNMKFLKNCPTSMVEDLGLNFTIANHAFGATREMELVRNGRNIPVTAANRIEYMHRVANYRMNTQIKQQSDSFLSGFSEIVSPYYIRLFSHEEIQLLISGKPGKIDLDDLRRNTKYSGGYTEDTNVIKWFWQAMSELGAEEQSKMLQFVTSSPRAPLLGFSYLVPGFCIHRAEGDIRLPTASTCMNLLKLPHYKSLDVMRQKLRYALDSHAGFNLS